MNSFLNTRWVARLLLVLSSFACVCVWGPYFWHAAVVTFQTHSLLIPKLFYGAIFFVGLFPFALTLLSFVCSQRFPLLFNSRTVAMGLLYSAFCAACVYFIFLMCLMTGLGPADNHPVQMRAASILFLVSMILFGIVLLFDALKIRPTFGEVRARFLVCAAYIPNIFLCYLVLWDLLCDIADKYK